MERGNRDVGSDIKEKYIKHESADIYAIYYCCRKIIYYNVNHNGKKKMIIFM